MKRLLPILVAVLLLGSLLLAACGQSAPAPTTSAPAATTSVPPKTTTTAPAATTSAPAPSTTAAPAKTYKFTYNNFFPPTHNNSLLAEMWMAEINKRTNGAVGFNYLPGASITAPAAVYDGVVNGISDIGFSVVSYTIGRFPASELIEYPQGYPNGYVATMVANDFFNKFTPAEFNDTHVFYFYATGPQVLFTTKKPVSTMDDLKGMVLRSTGIGAAIAKVLGGTGYAAAQNEAYELMAKGVIDGSIAPREVLAGWKQAEVVKYVTECFSVGSVSNMYVVMNKNKWNSLSPELQKVFNEVSAQWVESHAKVSSAYDASGMEYFKTQPGREEINLSAAESARWGAAMKPLVDKALADIKAKNLPADEYQKYIQERIAYWTPKTVSDADCAKWVKENVKKP
jgi:TRAP-type C4-dicarboxylate transport system substrate-binding protein